MHKAVILLIETGNRAAAIQKAKDFMEPFYEKVWDWYVIGGRWTGILTGYDPTKDPRNIETCNLCNGSGTRPDADRFGSDWKKQMKGCNGCMGTGKTVKFSFVDVPDNAMPLTDARVVAKVTEWGKNWEKDKLKEFDKDLKRWEGDKQMTAYVNRQIRKVRTGKFSEESNVYDVTRKTHQLPDSFEGYWAVVVDFHF
jgi:hypothetical protein